jgi:hypothetical protein
LNTEAPADLRQTAKPAIGRPYVILRLGPKRAEEGAYVWQKLMQSGAVVGNGTDAPVEDVSMLASFYASVSRKLKDGSVFNPE